MKYYQRIEGGTPEELTWENFVKGIQSEFMFGNYHYERMFVLLGTGQRFVGSVHMYWIDQVE